MTGQRRSAADASRRGRGAFYTPADVADEIARRTLQPLLGDSDGAPRPRIVDPACGDGQFLLAAWRRLQRSLVGGDAGCRRQLARHCLFGTDIDAHSVQTTRRRLAEAVAGADNGAAAAVERELSDNILCGNALVEPAAGLGQDACALDWQTAFPQVFRQGGFDAALINPPFLNSRRQARQLSPQQREYFRCRFATARRAFDMYVLFVERVLELLRAGGRCGAIVPNKIAAMEYAAPCRRLLARQTTLEWMVDAAQLRLFGAGVYPLLIVLAKQPPPPRHVVPVTIALARGDLQTGRGPDVQVAQASLSDKVWPLRSTLDVERRTPTRPLGEVAVCHGGTAGFAAERTAALLCEADEVGRQPGRWADFLVSGRIQRYQLRQDVDTRFMKRRWRRPRINLDDPQLARGRRNLFAAPKIVLAGMCRRLRAAWDDQGRALGVQVYAATDASVDRHYLLALLNSRLMSHLFRIRFAAKRLNGGYLSVNKSQLEQLPVRVIRPAHAADERLFQQLVRLSQSRQSSGADPLPIDEEIDRVVCQLYEVEPSEMARDDG